MNTLPRTRFLTVVAQDPSVIDSTGKIITSKIEIPAEEFTPGPCGYRVHVIDYDASTETHYIPRKYRGLVDGKYDDPFDMLSADDNSLNVEEKNRIILENPHFHCQNVYAIVMRVLSRFEFALGRRVNWGFRGHQLNVAPHAFADANAFYSEESKALVFGYFRSNSLTETTKTVFSCLSHDVVAHETTHAIIDGLRDYYTEPSSPEQFGFHEGFSDVVALLSVLSLKEIMADLILNLEKDKPPQTETPTESAANPINTETNPLPIIDNVIQNLPKTISSDLFKKNEESKNRLKRSILFGLADEMGEELRGVRGEALRRSIELKKGKYLGEPAFEEPHRCGELLVAAMMNAFLDVWISRVDKHSVESKFLSLDMVVEQGADAAAHLLTMAIRAIDYTPPTDITFADYLSALLTADKETVPDDSRYNYRQILKDNFKDYAIFPASNQVDGCWKYEDIHYKYDRTHFESMLSDNTEVFRFVWDNQRKLNLDKKAYTRVESVRPCLRIGPDGFVLRETVAEYIQFTTLMAGELEQLDEPIQKPEPMPKDWEIILYGSGTLVFDEYGRLKYHIVKHIFNEERQSSKINYLWKFGFFKSHDYTQNVTKFKQNLFLNMHLRRSAVFSSHFVEEEF